MGNSDGDAESEVDPDELPAPPLQLCEDKTDGETKTIQLPFAVASAANKLKKDCLASDEPKKRMSKIKSVSFTLLERPRRRRKEHNALIKVLEAFDRVAVVSKAEDDTRTNSANKFHHVGWLTSKRMTGAKSAPVTAFTNKLVEGQTRNTPVMSISPPPSMPRYELKSNRFGVIAIKNQTTKAEMIIHFGRIVNVNDQPQFLTKFLNANDQPQFLTKFLSGRINRIDKVDVIILNDALVDTKWFRPGETYSTKPTGNKWVRRVNESETIELEDYVISRRPFYARWYQAYQDRNLKKRIKKYEEDEMYNYVMQKIQKASDVIVDETLKSQLIVSIVLMADYARAAEETTESHKYGTNLIRWAKDVAADLSQPSTKIAADALQDFEYLRKVDPLWTWTDQDRDFCARMLERINSFAAAMADMVKYSFIIEPGTITPHLSEYVAEFRQLETFFERNQLSPDEAEQRAFSRNYRKARNKLLECADETRVILQRQKPTVGDSPLSMSTAPERSQYLLHMDDILGLIGPADHSNESDDFIHASYVRGGPLLNTFILTQAPLPSTINDFWHMVWQEHSKYIVMLCDAVDTTRLGLLDAAQPSSCPYYWPRYEHQEKRYGDYIVCNHKVDATIDPLFNVTHLSIRRADGEGNEHKFEHWQYNWNSFADFYWPLRILRRARMSPTPTIVHCLDGCGRSGTLVTIEALLMHLLRGSAHYDKLVLTTAIFVRLQRRHAISSPLQYLYIYRTLLHWMQPYITSNVTRFILGLIYPDWGFVGKYEKMIACRHRF